MNCLKCGRETDQTFCRECRDEMEKYPVKPGSIVLLPKRQKNPPRRSPVRRSTVTPEMQIARLKKRIRRLHAAIAVLIVTMAALGVGVFHLVKYANVRPVGQNYSTITKTVEEPEPTEPTHPQTE